jgi:hypothetical protein
MGLTSSASKTETAPIRWAALMLKEFMEIGIWLASGEFSGANMNRS